MSHTRLIALAASGLLLSGTIAGAQQQQPGQKQGPSGEATIVKRQATKIDCKQGARPVAAVIFTDPQQSQAQPQAGELVISISESDGQNASAGSEAMFEKKNALDGVVTHDFGAKGTNAEGKRALMITARRGNEVVEIQQIGTAGDNAMIYAIRKPKPEQPQDIAQAQQPKAPEQPKQPADAAQQAAAKQKADQEAAAQAQAAQQKAEAAPAEENDAVIMVYMVGAAK